MPCDAKSVSVILKDGSLFPMTHWAMGLPSTTKKIGTKIKKEIAYLWRFMEESSYDKEPWKRTPRQASSIERRRTT